MNTARPSGQADRVFSDQVVVVLIIVSADFYLTECTKQSIDLENQIVHWDKIFKLPLNEVHRTAMAWAYCICKKEVHPACNPFEGGALMGTDLKDAVIRALARSWGNSLKNSFNFSKA